jgi:hypothetical protein
MDGQVGRFHNSQSEYLITVDGVINENFFKIKSRETNLENNLEISHCKVKNPITGNVDLFLGFMLKSKYDGTPGIREPVDICITLDISGSMSCGIGPNQNDSKTRNDLSVEAIVKLTEQLNDDDGIAINTFDETSHNIVPFRLKKDLTKKNIDDIKKIRPTGNENIYNALEGAMQQLLESRKKNKRIILITDLWAHDDDLKQFKQLFKRCVHECDIEITIIGISQDANSHLAKIVAYEKGCNYYNVLDEKDLEKYLVKQFNYLCFPYSYNIKIKYNSDSLKIVKCIGAGEKKIEGEGTNADICDIGSAIPSELTIVNGNIYMEGGLILLQLKNKNEKNYNIDHSCELVLEYDDRNFNKIVQNYKYDIKNDINEENFFSSDAIREGIALYYYTVMCNNLLNYKNAYNQNSFLDLNHNENIQIREQWKKELEKNEKYHDNKLIKSTVDFLKNNYIVEDGLVNHYERYVNKIYEASELDTPKRYQGE